MKQHKNFSYHWQGMDKRGQKVNGTFQAPNLVHAKFEIEKQGISIKKITREQALIAFFSKKINISDIAVFSRQMATMMEAGIPLIQSFDILQKGQSKLAMKQLIAEIKRDIEMGTTFAEALNKHPALFNNLFCNLVDAGEKSGSLIIMLDKIADHQERLEGIRRKIKKILTYPIVVLFIALLITAGLLIFVIPQFTAIFNSFGAELPFLTRCIIGLSNFFQESWYFLFSVFVLVIFILLHARKHSLYLSRYMDLLLLKLPFFGSIIQKTIIARFARTIAITLSAGLPLIQSLQSATAVMGNHIYCLASDHIKDAVSCGQSIQVALENTALFPPIVVQMVAIGEESGMLDQMLSKIADYYEEEVDDTIGNLNILLEPLIMSILGVVVGVLLLALYVPIFKLSSIM